MQSATPALQALYDHFVDEGIEVLNIGDKDQASDQVSKRT